MYKNAMSGQRTMKKTPSTSPRCSRDIFVVSVSFIAGLADYIAVVSEMVASILV
jgi:hypothetical protein